MPKRNNLICDHSRVIRVEVVVKPVVVPVPLGTIPVEITNVQVAIRIAVSLKYLPNHHPLNTLRIVFYSA
jgi:hypothetical protein